jgi:hypothetical protein
VDPAAAAAPFVQPASYLRRGGAGAAAGSAWRDQGPGSRSGAAAGARDGVMGTGDTGLGEVRGRVERHAGQAMSTEEMIEDEEQIAALVGPPRCLLRGG